MSRFNNLMSLPLTWIVIAVSLGVFVGPELGRMPVTFLSLGMVIGSALTILLQNTMYDE